MSNETPLTPAGRLAITLLLVSGFVMILNETIMSIAVLAVSRDFEIELSTAQWILTAFVLTMAVVIPITGYLIQRLSTRTLFLTALSLFVAGTLISALSPAFSVLVIGRVIQACGTAIIMPLLMTTVMNLVPASRRGRIMGNISIVISVAPAIGPAVSGFILRYLPWPYLFWITLPIAVVILVIGARSVPNVSEPAKKSLDIISVVLAALAFSSLVFGLASIGESVHAPPPIPPAIPIAIGAVVLVSFVYRQIALQRRGSNPLLDLRTFLRPTYAAGVGIASGMFVVLFGVIILLPIYLQNVLLFEPERAGLLLLPGGLLMGILGPISGRIYDRFGPRVLLLPGSLIISAALWWMSTLTADATFGMVLTKHLLLSVGLGLMFTPLFTTALGALPRSMYSHGSATISTLQQLGAACGAALFVVIYTVRSVSLADGGEPTVAQESGGIQLAFAVGGALALGVAALTLLLRRADPEPLPSDPGGAQTD